MRKLLRNEIVKEDYEPYNAGTHGINLGNTSFLMNTTTGLGNLATFTSNNVSTAYSMSDALKQGR